MDASVQRHRGDCIKTTHVHIRGVPSTVLNSQVSKNFSSHYTNMPCKFYPGNAFYKYLQAVQINKQTPVAILDYVVWGPHEHYSNLCDTPSSVSLGST